MSDPVYRISYPAPVADRFLACMAKARLAGRRVEALRAAKVMMNLLAMEPLTFGESREEYPAAGLRLRFGFVDALSVYYGVHEQSKNVFIRTFNWSERK